MMDTYNEIIVHFRKQMLTLLEFLGLIIEIKQRKKNKKTQNDCYARKTKQKKQKKSALKTT